MKRVQDIFISDSDIKSQYVNNFLIENYNESFNLINNSNLKTKRITADLFQNLSDMLYDLEDVYFTNVPEFLSIKLADIQYFINNLKFVGAWNATTVYRAYNLVSYNNAIYLYIGENSSSGFVPSAGGQVSLIIDTLVSSEDSDIGGIIIDGGTINSSGILSTTNLYVSSPWLRLEIRGAQGEMGIGLNYRGSWSSSLSYNQYDSVFYNNALWACKTVNQNTIPQEGTYWDEIFKVYKAKIEDYSEIVTPYNGLICFEIIQ